MYRNITLLFLISSKLLCGAEQSLEEKFASVFKTAVSGRSELCKCVSIHRNCEGRLFISMKGLSNLETSSIIGCAYLNLTNVLNTMLQLIDLQSKQIEKLQAEVKQLKEADQTGSR